MLQPKWILPLLLSSAFAALLSMATPLFATTEDVLYSFCSAKGCKDGALPSGGLAFDSAGNLYGTTEAGGTHTSGCSSTGGGGCGTVFRLAPQKNGKWKQTVLLDFNGSDGAAPTGNLTFDSSGNLYGTTKAGGASGSGCGGYGCGTIFELTPGAHGTWTENVLYSFSGTDGSEPTGSLTFDTSGTLYGTTTAGGASGSGCGDQGCGTVFQLVPGGETWTESILYNFCSLNGCSDGSQPNGALLFDATGNLYGTTQTGGAYANGTAFELMYAGGTWTETVLAQFPHHSNGISPSSGLISDAAGNLYGTTLLGGAHCYVRSEGCGTVYELTPQSNGTWTETVLISFDRTPDSRYPSGGLVFDASGNLYGTTVAGGSERGDGFGTAFELSFENGHWFEALSFNLHVREKYGTAPLGGVILDSAGNLYGTTSEGGANFKGCGGSGCGTVFELTQN
jgi:uncharacterized repeat protein (TIGR03803 family)